MSNVVYFSKSECDAIVANFNGRYVIAQMYYFEWSNSFSLPSSVALCRPSAISVAAAGPAPAATAVPAVAFATTVTAAGAATVARSSAIAARPMRS